MLHQAIGMKIVELLETQGQAGAFAGWKVQLHAQTSHDLFQVIPIHADRPAFGQRCPGFT
jgi:hypothetical protein